MPRGWQGSSGTARTTACVTTWRAPPGPCTLHAAIRTAGATKPMGQPYRHLSAPETVARVKFGGWQQLAHEPGRPTDPDQVYS